MSNLISYISNQRPFTMQKVSQETVLSKFSLLISACLILYLINSELKTFTPRTVKNQYNTPGTITAFGKKTVLKSQLSLQNHKK